MTQNKRGKNQGLISEKTQDLIIVCQIPMELKQINSLPTD
jgi:hypothetical protein